MRKNIVTSVVNVATNLLKNPTLSGTSSELSNSAVNGFYNWSRSCSTSSDSKDSEPENIQTYPRVLELRKKLEQENKLPQRGSSHIFEISERGKKFLKEISSEGLNNKYSRGGEHGEGYVGVEEVIKIIGDRYYDSKEKDLILKLADPIQERMRTKISKSYLEHALNVPDRAVEPNPILKIVMPQAGEIASSQGENDPSNQNRYSPLPGLLHKYEMLLAFVSINCSSHCRYCYRLDLFSGISNKSKADMEVIAAYIKTYNNLIQSTINESGVMDKETGLWIHKENKEPLLQVREILLSGGDPMTLPNSTLARYMTLMAEAGIRSIGIGTKELAFNPDRFDKDFWSMMDRFHKRYPETKIDIVGHYSHPYELLEAKTNVNGTYLYDINADYQVRKDIIAPLHEINNRSDWVGHYNQFPIIAGINDSPDILRLLIFQTRRLGITTHNVYACREIIGHEHFRGNNTIEAQYKILEQSMASLSGLDSHARLVMSTEYGKIEVCGVEDENIFIKLNRFIHGNKPSNTIIRIDQTKLPDNQKFYWLTDEAINTAVSEKGKKTLEDLKNENHSLVKSLKEAAASIILNKLSSNEKTHNLEPQDHISIEVINRNGGSRVIRVDLADKKYKKRTPTLATVLAKEGEIEASCDEKLSCSTCVGIVRTDSEIPAPTEDELDLIDLAKVTVRSSNTPSPFVRAACQIPLQNCSFESIENKRT